METFVEIYLKVDINNPATCHENGVAWQTTNKLSSDGQCPLIYSFVNPSKCDKIRRQNDVKHKINGNEKAIVYKKCPFHPFIFFKLHLINVNQIKVRSDKCRKLYLQVKKIMFQLHKN